MKETIIFKLPNVEGEFEIIEKRGYTGRGYRYSLKYLIGENKEAYYCDSFKSSKTQVGENKLIALAINHINDMEVIQNLDLYYSELIGER